MRNSLQLDKNTFQYLTEGCFNVVYETTLTEPIQIGDVTLACGTRWVYRKCKPLTTENDRIYEGLDDPKRLVRLWNLYNPTLPAYLYKDGWICPYVNGKTLTAKDEPKIVEWLINFFYRTDAAGDIAELSRRILRDAYVLNNFKKLPNGSLACVDFGLAIQFGSIASEASLHYKAGHPSIPTDLELIVTGDPTSYLVITAMQALLCVELFKWREKFTQDDLKNDEIRRALAYCYRKNRNNITASENVPTPLKIDDWKKAVSQDLRNKGITLDVTLFDEPTLWAALFNPAFSEKHVHLITYLAKVKIKKPIISSIAGWDVCRCDLFDSFLSVRLQGKKIAGIEFVRVHHAINEIANDRLKEIYEKYSALPEDKDAVKNKKLMFWDSVVYQNTAIVDALRQQDRSHVSTSVPRTNTVIAAKSVAAQQPKKEMHFTIQKNRMLEKIKQYIGNRSVNIDASETDLNFASLFFRNVKLTKQKVTLAKELREKITTSNTVEDLKRALKETQTTIQNHKNEKTWKRGDFDDCIASCMTLLDPPDLYLSRWFG